MTKYKQVAFISVIIATQVFAAFLSTHYAGKIKALPIGGEPPGVTTLFLNIASWLILIPILLTLFTAVNYKRLDKHYFYILFSGYVVLFVEFFLAIVAQGQLFQ